MKATKEQVFEKLESLTTDAHQFACSLNIGAQRTEAFQIYEVLRRLQRRGALLKYWQQRIPFSHRQIVMRTTTDAQQIETAALAPP